MIGLKCSKNSSKPYQNNSSFPKKGSHKYNLSKINHPKIKENAASLYFRLAYSGVETGSKWDARELGPLSNGQVIGGGGELETPSTLTQVALKLSKASER